MKVSDGEMNDLNEVSKALLSETVQSALMNAIDTNLHLDEPGDLEKVKKGLLESFHKIGMKNTTKIENRKMNELTMIP